MSPGRTKRILFACIACLAALVAVVMLERQRTGLTVETLQLADSPVTVWRQATGGTGPLVVVAHGYAGSRQMMQPIAISLARAGFVVAAFDFYGHGRNDRPMAADITSLDGATAQLVDQTIAITQAGRSLPGVTGPTALVGHSMATDIVIRAAERMDDVAGVVAISMYSDAVDPQSPERLLVVSGAWEGRLREVALDRVRQVDPDADEGETVTSEGVARRAVAAPRVGHVGVLYSPTTLRETRDWIATAMQRPVSGAPASVSPWLALLLASIVAIAWPLAGLLGPVAPARSLGGRTAFVAVTAPVVPALAAATILPAGALGLSAFGSLAAFFGVWGGVQLIVLWWSGWRPSALHLPGIALLLLWGLALFAPALDRYGAAFVPTGTRLPVMVLLGLGTIPFCLADALIARASGWLAWLGLRLLPIVTLFAAMLITPRLGVAFTVLPVLVLFWLVYGLAGRWVRARTGPETSGLALGLILAWALAASTPLVAV
ncbi:alpha/beta fold hydrolase [Maribius pontilimi]|uniref:Alpha/beta fold hydrolase n=1 Tax=Palleronia pontilimi TaxID=1964209 RepID=A0A934ICA5_9RHOB|nr:alpha/beta fold hydrolase [Palleronia pontilimi]MBJ3764514.1 alpha/beta fold hydrolase [Palleronia pontilimi]